MRNRCNKKGKSIPFLLGMLAVGMAVTPAGIHAEEAASASASAAVQTCPAGPLALALGERADVRKRLGLASGTEYDYRIAEGKSARVTMGGMLVPLAQGTATLEIRRPAPPAGTDADAEGTGAPDVCRVPVRIGAAAKPKPSLAPRAESRSVKVGGRSFAVQAVYIPKGVRTDVGLGRDAIGGTEALASLAKRRHADAAVNGTFFEAYGGVPEPWGTVIADGEIAHVGNTGTAIGFAADGTAKMDSLRVRIGGTVTDAATGRASGWYAYFVNRTPADGANAAILFTPKRGGRIGFARGTAVVVRGGEVERVAKGENVAIPKDGYVLVYTGGEQAQAARFAKGGRVRYEISYTNADGQPIDWSDIATAVGAGPRLVKDGKLAIDAKAEGFTEEKILTSAAARSGIGIRKDGSIVVVATTATISQLGGILLQLGAMQGMNLDGGASSGLYASGKLRTAPGREISNALLFGQSLAFRP
ncbi:phosphodiester glycosidase family protein [Cohnella nanjingensis]|uniref:Phosphodiester glycosidase family protein n=1 Tax=Cohnella nanjingensis TaxID=1387779 RepID=A0A7X0RLF8_9BACL|nr:phosphodiester glycosidase family protein [Cohnella nanjingensis]MBB6669689.1 phosphodiester glycosidase family protein [Cohnella nanjingensis]